MNTSKESSGLWGFIVSLISFISSILLFYYLYLFIVWYIKGHFSKYFIFFWICTISSAIFLVYDHNRSEREYQEYQLKYGSKSGYELWNENMKDYDAVRGY